MKAKITKAMQALFVSLSILGSQLAFADNGKVTYRISVQNVTAGNGLSPFLVSVLKSNAELFHVGQPASAGLASIAETGSTALLESELGMNSSSVKFTKVAGGPLVAGEQRSVDIELDADDVLKGAKLSLVAMIGKSNDSFIAVKGIRLAGLTAHSPYRLNAKNYDAGSEENTGNVEDFGSGGHPTEFAEGKVSFDRGLNPHGDAPNLIAWGPIAAIVTIERIH